MASPKFNSKSPTIKRILKEASELATSPSPEYHASPASDSDLFDWHFTLRGPPGTPYTSGIYHGRIVLPPTYPLRPPSFRFLTPSGRFEVNREICLSISGHHEETWQPAWGIRTALVALRAFMESDARGQLGGLECTAKERERLAGLSAGWRCGVCGRSNKEVIAECEERVREKGEEKIEEVEVPKELSLGYKDDMQKNFEREKKEKEDEVLRQREGGMDEDAAELAEGFVGTGNPGEEGSSSASAYPVARPAQSVPQPTSTVPQHQTAPPNPTAPARIANAYPQQAAQRRSNDGVPIWIDRAIAGIVVCLVFMVLKILLGL